MNEDGKVSIHEALEMFTSGQLLFLGSMLLKQALRHIADLLLWRRREVIAACVLAVAVAVAVAVVIIVSQH